MNKIITLAQICRHFTNNAAIEDQYVAQTFVQQHFRVVKQRIAGFLIVRTEHLQSWR